MHAFCWVWMLSKHLDSVKIRMPDPVSRNARRVLLAMDSWAIGCGCACVLLWLSWQLRCLAVNKASMSAATGGGCILVKKGCCRGLSVSILHVQKQDCVFYSCTCTCMCTCIRQNHASRRMVMTIEHSQLAPRWFPVNVTARSMLPNQGIRQQHNVLLRHVVSTVGLLRHTCKQENAAPASCIHNVQRMDNLPRPPRQAAAAALAGD